MNDLFFSVDERLALLGTLLNRCEFIDKLILTLDSANDSKLIELYNKELASLNSVLRKLGYFNV